jgi:hypothetical protein
MLVGSFLPWISITTIFGTLSRSGVDGNGDGMISAALGIAAAGIGVALLNRESRAASVALAAIAALAGVLVYVDGSDIAGRLGDLDSDAALASIGIGLWVVGAGALLTGVMGLQGLAGARNPLTWPLATKPALPADSPATAAQPPATAAQPPDHGLHRCTNGAKIPAPFQIDGGPCPFCDRTLSETPTVADRTSERHLPGWLQVVIPAAVLLAALLLLYATGLDNVLIRNLP